MSKEEAKVYEQTAELYSIDGAVCCAICGSAYSIEMHHIRYGACGRKTYMGNVIPLCSKHHKLVHTNKKTFQPVLIDMINKKLEAVE